MQNVVPTAHRISCSNKLLIGVVFALALFHLLTLEYFPAPFGDEAWNLARVIGYRNGEGWFGQLDRGVFDLMPGYQSFFPAFPIWLHDLFISLFPIDDFYALRLSSWFCGIALAIICGLIPMQLMRLTLVDVAAARECRIRCFSLNVICLLLTWPFFLSSHLGRFDILAALFTHAALLVAIWSEKRLALGRGVLAALFYVAAFETHPFSMCVVPGFAVITVLALVQFDRDTFIRFTTGFVFGSLIGVACFGYLHFDPNAEAFINFYRVAFFSTHLPSSGIGIVETLGSLWRSFYYALPNIFSPLNTSAALALLILLPLTLIASLRLKGIALTLIYILILFSFITLTKDHGYYYFIHIAPASAWVLVLASQRFSRGIAALTTVGKHIFSIGALGFGLYTLDSRFSSLEGTPASVMITQIQQELRRSIHADDIVIGHQTPWLALRQNKYYSWEGLIYYQRLYPTKSWIDALNHLHPTILILDSQVNLFLNDQTHPPPAYAGKLSLPRGEFLDYLVQHGEMVDHFGSRLLGDVRIFRFRAGELSER